MFINDVNRKEEIRNIAVQHLKKYGIKYRPKKARPSAQVTRYGKKFFKVPLQNLETETVTLKNGQQLQVPKRIHEMCSYILSKVQTEGIFRKEGSKSRQHEIKLALDRGCPLGLEHHVVDVAVVLKCFLRELPEPLIPQAYNDLFLMCSLEKRSREDVLECLLLVCLLLPSENLNVLSYLMQFFCEVASYSGCNKMGFSNLSILVGPNIFPMDDKLAPKSSLTITRICDITRLLIENSHDIGVIPDYIISQIGQASDAEVEKRRKNKRRSGSLTRMLNGLKKIMSKPEDAVATSYAVTPDLLTPVHPSAFKKKKEPGLSFKKKKEVLAKLPDCALLNTPFTPSRTPVSANPNGKKLEDDPSKDAEGVKEKKMHWYMRSRSMKNLKEEDSLPSSTAKRTSLLERRWSAVSNAANFRKKKTTSGAVPKRKPEEPDYVRVPKTEFEDFKNRVSAIERRISLELDNVLDNHENNIENVQTVYQKTLEAAQLSPTTDQLAKRLSRDLRIRRSSEQKVIRSPSARKIGTIRRRSTEREKKSAQIVRNRSWHVGAAVAAPLLPRANLRKPDTNLQRSTSFPSNKKSRRPVSRVSSSPSSFQATSGSSSGPWVSAEGFFCTLKTPQEDSNGRASIAKLRNQNAGMVRAKARLFDSLRDSDVSATSSNASQPSSSSRVSTLRERNKKNTISPRRRPANVAQKQRLQSIGKQYVRTTASPNETALESPKRTPRPHIKAPLTLKTPKRLCRTPAVDKKTPFRAVASPRRKFALS